MKRLLVLALVITLCGCNYLTKKAKEPIPDSSEVAEVPDEVWKRVQKKIEERAKANAPKKEEQSTPQYERDRPQLPDSGRTSGAANKRK
jgi:hypothetical protein